MNKVFIQTSKIMTKVVMFTTLICSTRERDSSASVNEGHCTLSMVSNSYVNTEMVVLSMVLCSITFEKWAHKENVRRRPTLFTPLPHGEHYMVVNVKDPLASWGATSLKMDTQERSSSNRGFLHGRQMSQNVWRISKHKKTSHQVNKSWLTITILLVFHSCGWDEPYGGTLVSRTNSVSKCD